MHKSNIKYINFYFPDSNKMTVKTYYFNMVMYYYQEIDMNINSQYLLYPSQPDNPSDFDRRSLLYNALVLKGWPQDLNIITGIMSPPPDITYLAKPGQFKDKKVAVIGGGLAGLSSAFELRKLGFDITIFEAIKDRIGGRIYTYYFDRSKTLHHEFGAMRIPVSHETVWHYLKLFKLPTRPFIQYNPNGYVYLRNTRVRNDPNGFNVMRYIYPKYNLTRTERLIDWQKLLYIGTDSHLLNASSYERAEIIQVKPEYTGKALLWSDRSSINLMEGAGLSQEAINLVSNFLPLLYSNLYNSFIDYIQESYPANLTYLYEIPGGMVRLPLAFYNSFLKTRPDEYDGIPADCLGRVKYKAGCWVNGISMDCDSQKVVLDYTDTAAMLNKRECFDYIICTIPFSSLRNVKIDPLFSDIKMRAIREVNYISSQKTLLLCRERFWEKDGIRGGGSYTDLPIASIWYPSDCVQNQNETKKLWRKPGVLVGSFNFNLDTTRLTNLPKSMQFNEIKREIETVHGLREGYLDGIVADHKTVNWDEQPTIRGALCFFSPEQKRIFSYGMAVPEYNGRVFFAGEHISAVHRWMQGALQTGMQAANSLVQSIK